MKSAVLALSRYVPWLTSALAILWFFSKTFSKTYTKTYTFSLGKKKTPDFNFPIFQPDFILVAKNSQCRMFWTIISLIMGVIVHWNSYCSSPKCHRRGEGWPGWCTSRRSDVKVAAALFNPCYHLQITLVFRDWFYTDPTGFARATKVSNDGCFYWEKTGEQKFNRCNGFSQIFLYCKSVPRPRSRTTRSPIHDKYVFFDGKFSIR